MNTPDNEYGILTERVMKEYKKLNLSIPTQEYNSVYMEVYNTLSGGGKLRPDLQKIKDRIEN